MDYLTPLKRQLIVASSPQLAALSVGGITAYPVVLLNQLKANDTEIPLDFDSATWIASIHGFAGTLSILIPLIMQWRGRRFALILACLFVILGWITIYCAHNVSSLLLGESLHGIGGNSLIVVNLVTVSEMLDPKYRSTLMISLGIIQTLGLVVVTIAGYFLYWRKVCMVMCLPLIVALFLVLTWPESPPWLASKGRFKDCEEAFVKIRGSSDEAMKELAVLIERQKESLRQMSLKQRKNVVWNVWVRVQRRDFYVPNFHAIILLFTFYWHGPLVIFTYASEILEKITHESDFICFMYIDVIIVINSVTSVILANYFKNKSIIISSFLACTVCLLCASTAFFFKESTLLPKSTLLICILGYILFCLIGSANLSFSMATEVMPVKHRGIGGVLYIIYTCLFHSISIKVSPFLFQLIDVSGTFLCFAFVALIGVFYIWKYVPETKNITLQEIEDLYNFGNYVNEDKVDVPLNKENNV